MQGKNWDKVALVLVLLLEVWLFTGSWNKFFNHDSLFYIVDVPHSWQSFLQTFAAPDAARQYRPLTLGTMGFLVTLLGTDPRNYHWVPLILHLANTVLLYLLAKRLLNGTIAVVAAVTFWGLHSVAGWVNYDIGPFSDSLVCFLLLLCLLLAVDGARKSGLVRNTAAILVFGAALLTKESAITFPLAVGICLVFAHLRNNLRPAMRDLLDSIRKAAPVTIVCLAMALVFAAVWSYFIYSGLTYRQAADSAYNIGLWSNWWGKVRYLLWAMNFPHSLESGTLVRRHVLAWGLMALPWCACAVAAVWRRGNLSLLEWSGVLWLLVLNLPAWMLANRVGKWYLYVPLLGISLTLGSLIGTFAARFSRWKTWVVAPAVFALVLVPVLFSSRQQTQGLLNSSSVSYVSDLYQSFLSGLKEAHPRLPSRVTLYFLPPFEQSVAAVLTAPPINNGELYELYYPGTEFDLLFAHQGDQLPAGYRTRTDVYILQFLDGRLFDVSPYYKSGGRLNAFILPTAEGQVPPLLEQEPVGGRGLWGQHVSLMIGDRGAALPANYHEHPELWILEYLNGHFYDVTEFYKTTKREPGRHLFEDAAAFRARVSRDEYYPDYNRFDVPTGRPFFFPTPQRDILTQIGGSEVTIPLATIPPVATLRFDVSWMHDIGDGGWAEIRLQLQEGARTIFRRFMKPNPQGRAFQWQAVRIDLGPFARQSGELVLRCYNERGSDSVADWLNWRDLSIIDKPGTRPSAFKDSRSPALQKDQIE